MRTEDKEDGAHGPAWYTGDICLNELYCKGYFEIRCKVFNNTSRKDFWSAFWITVAGEYDAEVSKGGVGGCEIDVYESFANTVQNMDHPVGITPALWCNGVDDNDGVLWTDDYYIWYINGVECFRINYGSGPSQVPEEVRVSMCAPSGPEENMTRTRSQPGDYEIDYVRIYQIAD